MTGDPSNSFVISLILMEQTATGDVTCWDTGVDLEVLRWVGARSVQIPDDFSLHPTLKRGHVDARLNKLLSGTNLDWSTAETLAIASLLYQGILMFDCHIRLIKKRKILIFYELNFRSRLSN